MRTSILEYTHTCAYSYCKHTYFLTVVRGQVDLDGFSQTRQLTIFHSSLACYISCRGRSVMLSSRLYLKIYHLAYGDGHFIYDNTFLLCQCLCAKIG